MSTGIYTETKCDRCGNLGRREGAEGAMPPAGWSQVSISKRGDGIGWINSRHTVYQLCPACAVKLNKLIRQSTPKEQ